MTYENFFAGMSGNCFNECHALVHRYMAGRDRRVDDMQSMVLETEPDATHVRLVIDDLISGIWRAPSGICYATGDAFIHRIENAANGGTLSYEEVDCVTTGIWGLTDDFVIAWGAIRSNDRDVNKMYQFDGTSWQEMPAPKADRNGETVNVVHGISPDCLVAVGNFGLIAHWNGREWRKMDSPTTSHFSGLHVESAAEMYAVVQNGPIFKGSTTGWSQLLDSGKFQLSDIAKFAGRIFVAGQEQGLLELKGNELVILKDNIPAKRLESSSQLLMTCPDKLCSSADGQDFWGCFMEDFVPLIIESA